MPLTDRQKEAIKALIGIGAMKTDADVMGIREHLNEAVEDYYDEGARFQYRARPVQLLDRGCVTVVTREGRKYHMIEEEGVWHARHYDTLYKEVVNKRTSLKVKVPYDAIVETPLAQYREKMSRLALEERARRQGKLAPVETPA